MSSLGSSDGGFVELADSSARITADYSSAIGARSASPDSHPDWHFAPGDAVTVTWSHPGDLARYAADKIGIWYSIDGLSGLDLAATDHTDTEIHFTIPPTAPASAGSDSFLEIVGGDDTWEDFGDATSCSGAARCSFGAMRAYKHAVRVD